MFDLCPGREVLPRVVPNSQGQKWCVGRLRRRSRDAEVSRVRIGADGQERTHPRREAESPLPWVRTAVRGEPGAVADLGRDQSAHRQATPGANIAGRDRTRMRCLGAVAADRCKPPLRERGPARRGGGGKRWVLRCCSATNCGASWGASETFRGSRAWFATLSLHEAPEPHWCPLVLRPPRQLVLARSGQPDYPGEPA